MTETKKFKLKKPGIEDIADIEVLNENFDIIDKHLGTGGGAAQYVIDLSSKVSIERESYTEYGTDVSSLVDANAVLEARKNGSQIVLKLQKGDVAGNYVLVTLNSYAENNGIHYLGGTTCVFRESLSTVYMNLAPDDPLQLDAGVWIQSVPTTSLEQPRSVDMTNYDTGKIRLTYANDEAMDVSVEFDTNGNPIRFSNGTEEFTVTWPEEVATDE